MKCKKPNNKDMLGIEETPCLKCLRKTKAYLKDNQYFFCANCEGLKNE